MLDGTNMGAISRISLNCLCLAVMWAVTTIIVANCCLFTLEGNHKDDFIALLRF